MVQNLTDMVISNESRVSKSRVVLTYNKARQYQVTIPIRYQDMAKVRRLVFTLVRRACFGLALTFPV